MMVGGGWTKAPELPPAGAVLPVGRPNDDNPPAWLPRGTIASCETQNVSIVIAGLM
jgi:hypothetical protein